MEKLLILTILGLQATLLLIGINTLKSKLNGLEEQIKGNNVHIDGQAERIIANLEEVAQFNEKAIGTLSQNIAACGYEIKEVNKTIKDESAKNIAIHLRKF